MLTLLAVSLSLSLSWRAEPAGSGPLPAVRRTVSVTVLETELTDGARKRTIPLRIYLPDTEDRAPVILFSPGLGSSRRGYEYLGRAWASRGFVVVHLQHPDSDSSLSLFGLYRASKDRKVWINRPLDVTFVLDRLLSPPSGNSALARVSARIDPDHIGVAGHSYGAYTALVIAGGLLDGGGGKLVSLIDPRVDAVVALSSPRMRAVTSRGGYAAITVPVLHMTGTKDSSPVFFTKPHHRRIPFESITKAEQYLVTLRDAMHGSFSDRIDRAPEENLDEYHEATVTFTNAFWDMFLAGDDRAGRWLKNVSSDENRTVERRVRNERQGLTGTRH